MLTPEQIQKYRQQYSITPVNEPTSVAQFDESAPLTTQVGFGGAVAQDFRERQAKTKEIAANKNQSQISSFLQTAGQGAGFLGDVLMRGLSALTPDAIEKPVVGAVKEVVGAAVNTETGQKVVKTLSDWSAKHPEAAKNLEAALNVASLIPAGKGATVVGRAGKVTAKGVGQVAKPVTGGTGRTLKALGEKAYGLTVPMEESTSKAVLNYQAKQGSLLNRIRGTVTGTAEATKPITEANTAARYGLVGTEREIGVQAKRYADKIFTDTIAPKLSAAKEVTDMRQFISELEDQIVKETPELGRRNALLEGLEAFAEDYAKVGKIGGTKLQEYKEGWAKFIPEATYKGKPIGSAIKEVKNMAAGKARGILYEVVGDAGKGAYLDYGNLQSVIQAAIKAPTGDAAKRSFGRNVWEFVMDKAVTPVATMGGKVLYKTGEGLEFLGDMGAKKVGDIINKSDNLLDAGANVTKDLPMGMGIKDVSKKVSPSMGKIEPLISEARKYKSAEEFVKAGDNNFEIAKLRRVMSRNDRRLTPDDFGGQDNVTVWRTSDKPISGGDYVYTTKEDAQHALGAGQGKRLFSKNVRADEVIEAGPGGEFFYGPKAWEKYDGVEDFWREANGIPLTKKTEIPKTFEDVTASAREALQRNSRLSKSEFLSDSITKDIAKEYNLTKSQLTDIWNKANK